MNFNMKHLKNIYSFCKIQLKKADNFWFLELGCGGIALGTLSGSALIDLLPHLTINPLLILIPCIMLGLILGIITAIIISIITNSIDS